MLAMSIVLTGNSIAHASQLSDRNASQIEDRLKKHKRLDDSRKDEKEVNKLRNEIINLLPKSSEKTSVERASKAKNRDFEKAVEKAVSDLRKPNNPPKASNTQPANSNSGGSLINITIKK